MNYSRLILLKRNCVAKGLRFNLSFYRSDIETITKLVDSAVSSGLVGSSVFVKANIAIRIT